MISTELNANSSIYEHRAIVFFDILGFKQIVNCGKQKEIYYALQAPHDPDVKEKFFNPHHDTQISAFSDSVVLSSRITNNSGVIAFLSHVLYLVTKFLSRGMLVRGGITFGELHHRDGILFGPAMNEAYQLENELAIFPRIVVSDEFHLCFLSEWRQVYKEAIEGAEAEVANAFYEEDAEADANKMSADFFKIDFDGIRYFDFLSLGMSPKFLPPEIRTKFLKEHQENISHTNNCRQLIIDLAEKPLEDRPKEKRAAAKHEWFRNYLGRVREELDLEW